MEWNKVGSAVVSDCHQMDGRTFNIAQGPKGLLGLLRWESEGAILCRPFPFSVGGRGLGIRSVFLSL
jgi:hypothetical protein